MARTSRRIAGAAAAGVAAGALLAPLGANAEPAALSNASCGGKLTFLVWPHGHPALPKIRFPALPNPHVEVYLGFAASFPDTRAGAYIVGGTPPSFGPGDVLGPCLDYGTAITTAPSIPGGSTVSTETALECIFPRPGVIDIINRPGKVQILLFHTGKRIYARADASPSHVSVPVPASLCHKVPVPGR